MITGSQGTYPLEYRNGIASFKRTVHLALPENRLLVFQLISPDAVVLAREFGIPESHAIDELQQLAEATDLVDKYGQDEIQRALSEAAKRSGQNPLSARTDKKPKPPLRTTNGWRGSAITANALRDKMFDPIKFVLPGYITEGVTLLVSKPKMGKSWLVLDLCIATAAGNRFVLGDIKPEHGDVLYLALEDSQRRLQRRIDRLLSPFRADWPPRLTLVTEWRLLDAGGLDDLHDWCTKVEKPVLIVIDTLAKVRPLQKRTQSPYEADYGTVTGLHKLAHEIGVAVVAVHHDRKMAADDVFDTVSGTNGLTGAVDGTILIKRGTSGTVIYARGRDIEETEMAASFDKESCRWSILGDASEFRRSGERSRVIEVLKEAGEPLSPTEIAAAAGLKSRNAAYILLFRMVRDGEVERVKRGRYKPKDPLEESEERSERKKEDVG
jgi:hypothetical protein